VLHLPTIVDASVAAPSAAAAAATQIRKFLSKDNMSRPHVQYNAIMLIRILADNPGPSFTKNIDAKFVDTVKHLLRRSLDPSVRQIMVETLNALDQEKAYDTNLNDLFAMWRKEQGLGAGQGLNSNSRNVPAVPWSTQQGGRPPAQGGHSYSSHHSSSRHKHKTLPPPVELAARIEEARTSAKLLLQLVQSTTPAEMFSNDLIKEFAERCQAAQRSVQGYINCDNPAPDDDTMLTLIETNEQLSVALSKHQRAVLQARKALGTSSTPTNNAGSTSTGPSPQPAPGSGFAPPPGPPPKHEATASGAPQLPAILPDSNTPVQHSFSNFSQIPESLRPGTQRRPVPPPASQSTIPSHGDEPEDPFSDEQAYGAPQPQPKPQSQYRAYSPPNPSTLDPREHVDEGSPGSYHPGYHSTPSYMQRQESSQNNYTMHGAAGLQTPGEGQGAKFGQSNGSDVSPIDTRPPGGITYRY
jgi:hypothetical protein